MPGMEDEPSSTFTDLDSLFQKLHISIDDEPVSWRDDPAKVRKALQATSPPTKEGSWKDTELTYEERAALRKAEREQRQKEKETKEKYGDTNNYTQSLNTMFLQFCRPNI